MMAARAKADGMFLGFDFGTRRIGVAIGSRRLGNARALATLEGSPGPDWDAIEELIEDWQPEALIVGIPVTMEGKSQPATRGARAFMRQLTTRFTLPVHAADERLSTMEAQSRLRAQRASGQRRRRVRAEDLDSTAAKLILEHWMGSNP